MKSVLQKPDMKLFEIKLLAIISSAFAVQYIILCEVYL